ncbi:MAG TPA: DUF5343 domain-containing protein, partial [Thermoanaerobaculia bacterium]|nr:DUF5343 domain-containing protein [Thermoanaerobaculia bacterium]
TLFSKIASATVPDKFTRSFLQQTIGLKGSNDRAYIPLLRTLGFLDASGTPTTAYRQLKNSGTAKAAIAAGIRSAYAPLFASDESAHALSSEKLKGLIAQVAGTDEGMTARIASTFGALAKLADFSASAAPTTKDETSKESDQEQEEAKHQGKELRTEFHYNIQIHLPANGTEEVYLNIFNALRRVFQ